MDPEKSPAVRAADRLAAFAARLAFEDLPADAVLQAKLCLIDAVACAVFGAAFPWSRAIIDLIVSSASTGNCSVPEFALLLLGGGPYSESVPWNRPPPYPPPQAGEGKEKGNG